MENISSYIYTHLKGSNSKCKNYRGITLLLTAYTLYTNKIKKNKFNAQFEKKNGRRRVWLLKRVELCKMQYLQCSRQLKKRENNLPPLLLFTHYEKAYNRVNRHILWKIMENKI
jgi:hypothetical protein